MLRVSQNVFKINYLKKHLVKFIITQKVHSEIKALPCHEEGGCQEGPTSQGLPILVSRRLWAELTALVLSNLIVLIKCRVL